MCTGRIAGAMNPSPSDFFPSRIAGNPGQGATFEISFRNDERTWAETIDLTVEDFEVTTLDLREGCDIVLDVARDEFPPLDVEVCVANAGITMDPPRWATRFTTAASSSAGSPVACSRSPYVDSHNNTSAFDGGVTLNVRDSKSILRLLLDGQFAARPGQ